MPETLARTITETLERARAEAHAAGTDAAITVRADRSVVTLIVRDADSFVHAEATDHDAGATGQSFTAAQREAMLELGWAAQYGSSFRRQFGLTQPLETAAIGALVATTFGAGYGIADLADVLVEAANESPLSYAFQNADMQRAFAKMVDGGLHRTDCSPEQIDALFAYWGEVLDRERLVFRLSALVDRSTIPLVRIEAEARLCSLPAGRLALRVDDQAFRLDGDELVFEQADQHETCSPTPQQWQAIWATVEKTGLGSLPHVHAHDGIWELRLIQGSRRIEVAGDLPLPKSISALHALLVSVMGTNEPEAEEAIMTENTSTFAVLEHRFDELVESSALDPSLSVFERLYTRSGGTVSAPVPNEPAVIVAWAVDAVLSAGALRRPALFLDPDSLRIESVFSPAHQPAVVISLREPGGEFWLTTGHLDPRELSPIGTADRASTLAMLDRVLVHANALAEFMTPADPAPVADVAHELDAPVLEAETVAEPEPLATPAIELLPVGERVPFGTFPTPEWVETPAAPVPMFGSAAPALAYPEAIGGTVEPQPEPAFDSFAASHLSIVQAPPPEPVETVVEAPVEVAEAAAEEIATPVVETPTAAAEWVAPTVAAPTVWAADSDVPAAPSQPEAIAPEAQPIVDLEAVVPTEPAPERIAPAPPIFALPSPEAPVLSSPIFAAAAESAPPAPPADLPTFALPSSEPAWSPEPELQPVVTFEPEPESDPVAEIPAPDPWAPPAVAPAPWTPAPPVAEPLETPAESPFGWAADLPASTAFEPEVPSTPWTPLPAPAPAPGQTTATPFGWMPAHAGAAPAEFEVPVEPEPAPVQPDPEPAVPFGYVAGEPAPEVPVAPAELMSSLLGITIRYPAFVQEDGDRHRWDMALLEAAQIFNLPVTANEVQVAAQNIYRGVA